MRKQELLAEDVLRALATWHGVGADELGDSWVRLASAFARAVEFSGMSGPDRDPVLRASLVLDAIGDQLNALSNLVE